MPKKLKEPVSVDLVVHPQIKRDELIANLDKILKMTGCPACGLGGLDLRLRGDSMTTLGNLSKINGAIVRGFRS